MVLDCVLQLLQEGQIRGLARAQTLLILGGMAQNDGCVRSRPGEHRKFRGTMQGAQTQGKEAGIGTSLRQLPDPASTSPHPPCTALPCPCSAPRSGPLWTGRGRNGKE